MNNLQPQLVATVRKLLWTLHVYFHAYTLSHFATAVIYTCKKFITMASVVKIQFLLNSFLAFEMKPLTARCFYKDQWPVLYTDDDRK